MIEFSAIGEKLYVFAKYKYHDTHLITKTASLPPLNTLNTLPPLNTLISN